MRACASITLSVIGAFEKEKNRVNLVCLILQLLLAILRHIFGVENLEEGILTIWIRLLGTCKRAMTAATLGLSFSVISPISEASIRASRARYTY